MSESGNYLRGIRPPPLKPFRPEKGRKKIIVATSPTFGNWRLLASRLDSYTDGIRDPIILIGDSDYYRKGGKFISEWAGYFWLLYRIYYCDPKHKERAEFIRNIEMIKQANMVIAFHNGNPDPSLDHLIRVAKLRELDVRVVKYKPKAWVKVIKVKKPKVKIKVTKR